MNPRILGQGWGHLVALRGEIYVRNDETTLNLVRRIHLHHQLAICP
ncbi:hypothetical protein PLANTIT3_30158 [Plantibacter sp. T3]|nr:hypothetical protein PLANTIT3_30158 [Plantibacter sp. T3]